MSFHVILGVSPSLSAPFFLAPSSPSLLQGPGGTNAAKQLGGELIGKGGGGGGEERG